MAECPKVVSRALISVSDKTGIVEVASALKARGIEILSTGGTASLLRENGIDVKDVSSHTGQEEIMGGRVKTLHPKIHGGILGRRDIDAECMQSSNIDPIDLVIVNLYPFEETISKESTTLDDAVENIDIGGPAMIRASAKNFEHVAVLVDPNDYRQLLDSLEEDKLILCKEQRYNFAVKAFAHTAHYDSAIFNYLKNEKTHSKATTNADSDVPFPDSLELSYNKKQDLRYGENSHQRAAFYVAKNIQESSVSTAKQLQGKALSFNNIADTDAALECVKEFDEPACVIVKHANPCGVAVASTIAESYQKAFKTDPTSAFGGIIAFNRELDSDTAQIIVNNQFVEVIIAPRIDSLALDVLSKKPNVRVLECGDWRNQQNSEYNIKKVNGGILLQDRDDAMVQSDELKIVTKVSPTKEQLHDLLFCWKVAKHVKSNAIVYSKDNMTVGIGAGQMSRVYSAKVALLKAKDEGLIIDQSVMASDAFFPFRDSVDAAAEAGVSAIIQPGGSIRDNEVIEAANEHGIAMVFTNMRHFNH